MAPTAEILGYIKVGRASLFLPPFHPLMDFYRRTFCGPPEQRPPLRAINLPKYFKRRPRRVEIEFVREAQQQQRHRSHRLVSEVVDLAGEVDVAAADGGQVLHEAVVEAGPTVVLRVHDGSLVEGRAESPVLRFGLRTWVAEGQA